MSQTALFLETKQGSWTVRSTDIPKPGPGEILVKEQAVGLNPVDWKIQAYDFWVENFPAILGQEAAGIVEEVGPDVTGFAKGDKVFHQADMNNRYAAFQQYVVAPVEIVAKIPEGLTFDQTASIPVGVATATIPLYREAPTGIGLTPPWEGGRGKYAGQPIFIFGGATSVGQYVIQLAKLSGFSPIITTASPHNEQLLKSYGATHVLDRKLPAAELAAEVKKITSTAIKIVYDSVALPDTQQVGYDILAPGGHIVLLLASSIKVQEDANKTILGVFGNVHPPNNREFGAALYKNLTKLLVDGDLKPNPVEVVPGGLNGILPGLDKLKNNLVSGKKLIVHPFETV